MFPRKKLPEEDEAAQEAPLFSPDLPTKTSLVYEVDCDIPEGNEDNSETTSDDDAHRITKLSRAERVSTNRRLQALEKRSMNSHHVYISTFEASELDLLSLIDKQEWKHVLRRIGNSPKSMSEKLHIELDGRQTQAFPLHLAVNVVDAMVAVHPSACKIPDDTFGQLPLHIACKFLASTEVLKCLLDSFPEAIRLTDTAEGRLPLHYACVDGYPYDISMLIAAEKRALTCKDAAGKTPVDLVNESTSSHRDQIIKRIFKVAKADAKKSKRRKAKEQQAPATPLERYEPPSPDQRMHVESPSELSDTTQEVSNVRTMKEPTGKAKSILPAWARGRKARMDVDQTPVKRGSSFESPKTRYLQPESHTKGSSLERIRPPHRKTFLLNNFSLEALSFPKTELKPSPSEPTTGHKKNRSREDSVPDMVSNETEIKLSPSEPTGRKNRSQEDSVPDMVSNKTEKEPSPSKASGSSSKDRKKIHRRDDSVAEIASLVGPPKTMDLSSLPDAASLPLELSLNESIDEDTKESISNTAPTVPRRKKKGLDTNSDLIAFAGGEDKKLSVYEYGSNSDPFPLSLTALDNSRIGNSLPNLFQPPPLVSRDRKTIETNLLDKTPSISTNENRFVQTERFKESPPSCSLQSVPNPKASPNPLPDYSEIMALNAQLHNLELRKAALVEECNHVSETIMKKREKVQQEQGKLIEMKLKLMELEQIIDREQAAVDFAESSIKLHQEILSDHKDKIQAADQELTSLRNKRNNLIQEEDGGEMRLEELSTSSATSASSAEVSTDSEQEVSWQDVGNRFDEGGSSQATI